MVKFVVVTGGSVSGLGKGTLASSVGVVLRSCGYRVTAIKIDPYLNVDAGTIAPGEHGEVFVLDDGHEGDLDLGNYERALEVKLTKDHNITTGKIYRKIIQAERNGDYLGATVQMVPHVTDAIQEWIECVAHTICVDGLEEHGAADFCLIEVGGTVGDIESSVYLEALQQFFARLDRKDYCLCHLIYIPQIGSEQKTKCAQHSFKALREAGLAADFILGRAESMLEPCTKRKLSVFSGINDRYVIGLPNVKSSYLVPGLLLSQNFGQLLTSKLDMPYRNPHQVTRFYHGLSPVEVWTRIAEREEALKTVPVTQIGFVAKYIGSNDTYLSVVRGIEHSATECMVNAKLVWIHAECLSDPKHAEYEAEWTKLRSCQGVLVPGGFGQRGAEGMVAACGYARKNRIPFFGICLGMQMACVEGARSLLNIPGAGSEEFGAAGSDRVIVFMPETINKAMGGTMRLGRRATHLCSQTENGTLSLAFKLYDQAVTVDERHRHRYEFNMDFHDRLAEHGYRFIGKDESGQRLEVLEIANHPFFLAVQYHPELTSKPGRPNPCFLAFVLASAGKLNSRFQKYDNTLRPGAEFFI
ncbi:CTP synthase [Gregarina niphandrodes]|uniref:CTP synthase n=1 Tax=Gregarina niphandrodes TaxID=110365 RepID=A0A023B867_GRENI|nr:CTP synthase [Gregarina niphandrodes]EZG68213.1 CTP synthase [Gregarina niphandrodes]|eukprot:XP_011130035.1 CTP synthase [Gregarina niphandrodes]